MKQYLLRIFLAIICCSSFTTAFSVYETSDMISGVEQDGFTFELYKASKTGRIYATTNKGDITIPSQITYNNDIYTITQFGFTESKGITSVKIPETIITIPGRCFNCFTPGTNCELTTLEIPNSVTSIGKEAFVGLNKLKSITLSKNITSIGEGAFRGCSSLEEVINLPAVDLSNYIFMNCLSLKNITIPEGVKKISYDAFYNCPALETISLPSTLEEIGTSAFYGCTSLKSIILPESLTKFGDNSDNSEHPGYSGCFAGCTNLLKVTIPSKVTTIYSLAFQGCTQLQTIYLGAGVTTIEKNSFEDCTNLKQICISATTPPSVDSNSGLLTSNNYENCTVYVPEGSLNAYQNNSVWSKFKLDILGNEETDTEEKLKASFTDANPTIKVGTYEAGNLTYTREGEAVKAGNYATLCLPFSINLEDATCFSDVYIPLNIGLYKEESLMLLMEKVNMASTTLQAGQPFLAKLKSNKIELKNSQSTYIRESIEDDLMPNMEKNIKIYNFSGNSGVLYPNSELEVKFCGTFKKLNDLDNTIYRTFGADGRFYGDNSVSSFRAYIYKANLAAQASIQNISWGLGDETTGIKYLVTPEPKSTANKIFTLDGKLVNQTGDTKSLKKGIYIINGRKIIIN